MTTNTIIIIACSVLLISPACSQAPFDLQQIISLFNQKINMTAYLEGFNKGVQPDLAPFANEKLKLCIHLFDAIHEITKDLSHDFTQGKFKSLVSDVQELLQDVREAKYECADLLRFYIESARPFVNSIEKNPLETIERIFKHTYDNEGQIRGEMKDWANNVVAGKDEQAGRDNGAIFDTIFDIEAEFY